MRRTLRRLFERWTRRAPTSRIDAISDRFDEVYSVLSADLGTEEAALEGPRGTRSNSPFIGSDGIPVNAGLSLLRELLHEPPSQASWSIVCKLLDHWEEGLETAFDYA